MGWTLRELRFFITAVETGSFTDAAVELHVSQAAVSRTIAALERSLGEQLLRRGTYGCEPTATGKGILPHARKILSEADRFDQFLITRQGQLRLGYAWAALGRHTAPLQRLWTREHDDITLELVRHDSPTSGLAEGFCDVAILRRPLTDRRYDSVVVGLERRLVAFASDDAMWARRRQLSMAELSDRTVLIDTRSGSTTEDLWRDFDHPPQFLDSGNVDSWLDAIAAGRAIGTTAAATADHHPRPGVTYRPVTDGPRIAVRLAWWRDDRPAGLADLIDAVTHLYSEHP